MVCPHSLIIHSSNTQIFRHSNTSWAGPCFPVPGAAKLSQYMQGENFRGPRAQLIQRIHLACKKIYQLSAKALFVGSVARIRTTECSTVCEVEVAAMLLCYPTWNRYVEGTWGLHRHPFTFRLCSSKCFTAHQYLPAPISSLTHSLQPCVTPVVKLTLPRARGNRSTGITSQNLRITQNPLVVFQYSLGSLQWLTSAWKLPPNKCSENCF